MKVTIVPAQVTTVEDRVAGNLGFTQLILFAIPVFGGSLLYAILPPSMGYSLMKLLIILCIALIASLLAIRVRERLILLWLVILVRYHRRPAYYLFDKNTAQCRETYPEPAEETDEPVTTAATTNVSPPPRLTLLERAHLQTLLDDPIHQIEFDTTKKGGLNVRIREIQKGQ